MSARCDHCTSWTPKQHIKRKRCMPVVGYCRIHRAVTLESGHCAAGEPSETARQLTPGTRRDFLVDAVYGPRDG